MNCAPRIAVHQVASSLSSGVRVSAVARGSRAAQNGLRKDDVVLAATSGEFNDLGGFRASFS